MAGSLFRTRGMPSRAPAGISILPTLLLALLAWPGRADQAEEGRSFTLTWDNDAVSGSDRHYTQGGRATYYSRDNTLPGWLSRGFALIPAWGLQPEAEKFGLEVGQDLYTPQNLRATDVVADDRPYAAWLYASGTLRRRGPGPGGVPVMESFRLDLGVIGPSALGEEAQKTFHGLPPAGWGNQLRNEPAFALRYERRYLAAQHRWQGWGGRLIPRAYASAGTLATHLGLGLLGRAGFHVPDEFETPAGPTAPRWGAYVFTSVEGRAVARDIFLDGNTWRSSHHVRKEPLVGDFRIGLTVTLKRVELTAAYNWSTEAFRHQEDIDGYGTVAVRLKF